MLQPALHYSVDATANASIQRRCYSQHYFTAGMLQLEFHYSVASRYSQRFTHCSRDSQHSATMQPLRPTLHYSAAAIVSTSWHGGRTTVRMLQSVIYKPQCRLVGMARRSLGQPDRGAKREGQGARDRKKGTFLAVLR